MVSNGYFSNQQSHFTEKITRLTVWNSAYNEDMDMIRNASDVKLQYSIDGATTLTFTTLRSYSYNYIPNSGDLVTMDFAGKRVFTGRVFVRELSDDVKWAITAYDNMRYLKGTGTIVWGATTSSQRLKTIAETLGLPYEIRHSSLTAAPAEVSDGVTFFDMLSKAIEYANHDGKFVIYADEYGKLIHEDASYLDYGLLIGDRNGAIDFTFKADIEDLYNQVTVTNEDSETKQRTSKTASDYESMDKYGPLFMTENADSNTNSSQMLDKAKSLLNEKNKEKISFSLSAIGDMRFRAGTIFYVDMYATNAIGVGQNRRVFATQVTHTFDKGHTMEIEVDLL